MLPPDRYLPLDEEGYFVFDGRRVDDEALGRLLLKNLKQEDARTRTSMDGQEAWVEYFDAPLIARHVRMGPKPTLGEIDLPYRTTETFEFASLSVDEWDRFHGLTSNGIPFVFSRGAQIEFFELLDSFDDDSITVKGKAYAVPPWLDANPETRNNEFWSNIYRNEKPPWELGSEAAALPQVLPQLRLSKSRVLVLGSGSGNDAAYFASQGHNVTAVDFSAEAIAQAKQTYGSLENLQFVQEDIFKLPSEWTGRFDLVFEHTCYCAITPERRNELVQVWRRMLHGQGHLLGVFFVMEKRFGPPFGGSEWELRERLKKGFEFLFWTRWRASIERRKSQELVIYAKKRETF